MAKCLKLDSETVTWKGVEIEALIDRFHRSVFAGDVSLQDAAAGLITNVGSRTAEVMNQRDVQQLVFDRADGGLDACVFGRQESDERNHQQAGVEARRSVGLRETSTGRIDRAGADVAMNLVAR